MKLSRQLLAVATLGAITAIGADSAPAQNTQHYKQTNLVSDMPSAAPTTDPHLVNPWGLSRSSTSPWWASDNGTGLSTLYTGTGSIVPLVVTIPTGDPKLSPTGTPTGTVFNGGTGFKIAGKPAAFLFVTEDGTVSGWNGGTSAVIMDNTHGDSVFKGATIATVDDPLSGPTEYLYVADFRKARIQIYDTNFHPVTELARKFTDRELPAGYAPFNIQNIGGNLYVAFAAQDSAKHDEVDGPGRGYVDVFSPSGKLLLRFDHGHFLNAPWGLVQAPGDFGIYSHDILVGNFGSGRIAAFNPVTGDFLGFLRDASNDAIRIQGLWGLSFGSDGSSGAATSLYFAAGPNGEQNGLFGMITAVENIQGNDD